jgi:hypothetical protein
MNWPKRDLKSPISKIRKYFTELHFVLLRDKERLQVDPRATIQEKIETQLKIEIVEKFGIWFNTNIKD